MDNREQRAEKIRAASHEHPIVRFAAQSLLPNDTGFGVRPTMAAQVEEKLRALGPTDTLVSAVLGLAELAYVLRKQASPQAADAIVGVLAKIQQLVDDALSTLPPGDEALAALRSQRFAAFQGNTSTSAVVRSAPTGNQVSAGPMARASMAKKKPKP
jgi:hypothetical protein